MTQPRWSWIGIALAPVLLLGACTQVPEDARGLAVLARVRLELGQRGFNTSLEVPKEKAQAFRGQSDPW